MTGQIDKILGQGVRNLDALVTRKLGATLLTTISNDNALFSGENAMKRYQPVYSEKMRPMNIQKMISRTTFCLLAWSVLAAVPAFAQTITHVPLFTIDGDVGDRNFGISVSGAGDVNGDGFDDLIAGAPGDDNNGNDDSGSARVFSGADGSILYTFDGDSALDVFGESVSGAGDVNGDGFDDLIVGAPGDDNNGSNSGSARVFSGVDGSVLYTLHGDAGGDFFGTSVSDAGDVNGDGVDDLIVGATVSVQTIRVEYARVFSGADGSILYTFFGDSLGNFFGSSVSGAGDVNSDGFDDLIVGAPRADNNGLSSGTARVFSGANGSVLYDFDGDSSNNWFGISVSGAGDVNGDGFDDFIVGASRAAGGGIARVFSGSNGSVLYDFDSNDSSNVPDDFGVSVSGVGDVNGDGVPDFVVGAENGGSNFQVHGHVRLFVSRITATEPSVTGDFDLDGDVDLEDLDRYIGNIGESASGDLELLDLDGDGTVGANDFEQHYETLVETSNGGRGTFAGDANLDGTVTVLGDAFALIGNLGRSVTSWADGDFNGDGTVNVLGDAFLLVANLGRTNEPD